MLGAFVLAFDDESRGDVGDPDRGVRLVDVLATGAGCAKGVDAQIRGVQIDRFHFVELGQDRDGDRRRMDAPLRLGRRHPLHAMRAGFELEHGISAPPDDAADDFFVAAVFAGALAENLDLPALGFRVAPIHTEQVSGEDRRLVAARAGTDFEKNVAVVLRILRDQQPLQFEFIGREPRLQGKDFLASHGLGFRIRIRGDFLRCRQIRLQCGELAIAFDQGLQPGILHRQLAKLILAPNDARIRQEPADFLESLVELLEFAPDGVFHLSAGCVRRSAAG